MIAFNPKITSLWSSHAEMNDAGRNISCGVDLDGDGSPGDTKSNTLANATTSDYLTSSNVRRETGDSVNQIGDYQFQVKFSSTDPGDHFRVTVMPEPDAYGPALAGMSVVAVAMRRRKAASGS